jgi:processing peptidase subunit alpha
LAFQQPIFVKIIIYPFCYKEKMKNNKHGMACIQRGIMACMSRHPSSLLGGRVMMFHSQSIVAADGSPSMVPSKGQQSGSSSSFFGGLFGGSSGGNRVSVPLTDPLPGVTVSHVEPSKDAPKTEMTTLSNGVKIASENTPGATATLGLYVNSGSIYEGPTTMGVSHLLEYMAFKATTNRSSLRIVREIEAIGASVMASASREQMAYTIDTTRATVPEALEILSDAVLNQKLELWEVKEAIAKMEEDVKNLEDNPQTTLLEALHSVAYSGALGRPLIAPKSVISGLSPETVREFVNENYTGSRIALSGAGVEHTELVRFADPLLSTVPAGGAVAEPASHYLGGDWRHFSAGPLTHGVLAFEHAGGWNDVKGSVVATVLQYLLGGGGSFSAGGPGKGMHSRLYTRVLNQYHWMHNCTAVTSIYNNTGLVGIFASAESTHAEDMVAVMCQEMEAVANDLTSVELERAKAAATSSVLMNLESRSVISEDIGRQVLTYGHRKPISEFIAAIQGVTTADITKAVSAMLKTPPTLATVGDISAVPRYDLVVKRFG